MPVVDQDMRRLRFLKMVEMKIRGATNADIAREFNVSTKTVERTLTWGKRAKIIVDAEDHLLQQLLPKAQKVLEEALQSEDEQTRVEVALKIYTPTVLKREKKAAPGADPAAELARHIAAIRAQAQLEEETTDGELIEVPEGPISALLAAPDPSNAPDSDPTPSESGDGRSGPASFAPFAASDSPRADESEPHKRTDASAHAGETQ